MDQGLIVPLEVIDLGRQSYGKVLVLQQQRHQAVVSGEAGGALFLVEHDPVITVSRRRDAAQHVRASGARLAALGIATEPTDRGGDVTYHGPGQLVAYPILRLEDHGLNLSRYMRLLELAVLDTLAALSPALEAVLIPGRTGVWVARGVEADGGAAGAVREAGAERGGAPKPQPLAAGLRFPAKICAMGVRIQKGATMHGLALNVSTDLSHFDTIVPCGLADASVTSLAALLGANHPTMGEVKAALAASLNARLRQSS